MSWKNLHELRHGIPRREWDDESDDPRCDHFLSFLIRLSEDTTIQLHLESAIDDGDDRDWSCDSEEEFDHIHDQDRDIIEWEISRPELCIVESSDIVSCPRKSLWRQSEEREEEEEEDFGFHRRIVSLILAYFFPESKYLSIFWFFGRNEYKSSVAFKLLFSR